MPDKAAGEKLVDGSDVSVVHDFLESPSHDLTIALVHNLPPIRVGLPSTSANIDSWKHGGMPQRGYGRGVFSGSWRTDPVAIRARLQHGRARGCRGGRSPTSVSGWCR